MGSMHTLYRYSLAFFLEAKTERLRLGRERSGPQNTLREVFEASIKTELSKAEEWK